MALQAWGAILKHARNWMRLAAAYFPPPVLLKAAAYMCAYCYCLKAHLRQGRKRKDPSDPTAYKDNPRKVGLAALCRAGTCMRKRVGIGAACVVQAWSVMACAGHTAGCCMYSPSGAMVQTCAASPTQVGMHRNPGSVEGQ